MKTSLVCLLLLAAVACAAPAEGGEESVAAAGAKADIGARTHCLGLPECYGHYGNLHGCFFDYCHRDIDIIFYDYAFGCYCCAVPYGSLCV